MNSSEEIRIELSRAKVLLLAAGSLTFVALGFWLLTINLSDQRAFGPFRSPLLIRGTGLASICFFGWCGVIAIRKLFDAKPGLIFNNSGLVDNSSGLAVGLIPWAEITGMQIYEIQNQRFITIFVSNPERYLEAAGPIKRWFSGASTKMCGSPISISANALRIDFNELHSLLTSQLRQRGINA